MKYSRSMHPCSLNSWVVQAVWLGFKYPEPMKYSRSYIPCSLHYSIVQEVLLGSTNMNLQNILLWCLFSQLLNWTNEMFSYDSCSTITQKFEQFGWFQPTWTHELILRPSFLRLLSSSSRSVRLNHPELIKYSSVILRAIWLCWTSLK